MARGSRRLVGLIAFAILADAVPASADFVFPNFSALSNLNLLGSAVVTGTRVRLTPPLVNRSGTMIFSVKQTMRQGFETRFQFQITGAGGILDAAGQPGGDGLALIIQNQGPAATGLFGPAPLWHMPYSIPDALALEFDTWQNETGCQSCFDVNDPDGNHISLQPVGPAPDQLEEYQHDNSLGFTSAIPSLSDGNVHEARIRYVPGSLRVFIDGALVLTVVLDLTNVNGTSRLDADGAAWIGLGGGTGGAFQNHDILTWSFTSFVPPTASAGPDHTIHAGDLVTLDGTASFDDNTAGADLTYAWTLTDSPDESSAALAGHDTPAPTFVADLPGEYEATLVVTDADGLVSLPDSVVIGSLNAAPVADAGPDQAKLTGEVVTLDGLASEDPDGDALSFSWTLTTPAGSASALVGDSTASPSFTPDVSGDYTAFLTVTDPYGAGAADDVLVSVIGGQQAAEMLVMDALNLIAALPPDAVTSRGNRRRLQRFLNQTLRALDNGNLDRAQQKLLDAIERTDGCVLRGSPDGSGRGRDWITDCAAQASVYQLLIDAWENLAGR
jgi:hypothetical protein